MHALFHAVSLVGKHTIHIGQIQKAVQHEHRHMWQTTFDGVFYLRRLENRSHQHSRLHLALFQRSNAVHSLLVTVSCVQNQAAITVGRQITSNVVCTLNVMLSSDIRHQNSHQLTASRDQSPGRLIGDKMIFLQQSTDFCAVCATDSWFVIDDSGNRAGGNACLAGNVINRHWTSNSFFTERMKSSAKVYFIFCF